MREAVSAIALRRQIIRRRRHLTTMAAVLATALALAVHHSDMAIGDMHDHHDGMSAAIAMCLGVLTAVGTVVTAGALGVLALGRWGAVPILAAVGRALHVRPPIPRSRAGPPLLCLLCVSRR